MRLDALTLEILRNYLQAAVEDMARVVERTAYTTFVKETADFTCGLLNPAASSSPIPWSWAWRVSRASTTRTRSSWLGRSRGRRRHHQRPVPLGGRATHLPDIHLVRPIFWEGRLIG